jgi:hypothetical protein
MREFNLNKSRCISVIVFLGGFSLFWVFFLIMAAIKDKESFGTTLMGIVFGIGLLLFLIKSFFECLITFLRFCNLRIEILRGKLILRTDTKECEILMTEDTTVVYCMDGWLIVWPSKENHGIILLTRYLLGDDFLEWCSYFQEHTHYIPSQSVIRHSRFGFRVDPYNLEELQPNADYDAAYKEEKKLLKSLKINRLIPLKYIKWPA